MSVDLHTGQIQGFFNIPLDHLTALPLLVGWLEEHFADQDIVIASPDAGGVRLAQKFSSRIPDAGLAFLAKTRTRAQRGRDPGAGRRGRGPHGRASSTT